MNLSVAWKSCTSIGLILIDNRGFSALVLNHNSNDCITKLFLWPFSFRSVHSRHEPASVMDFGHATRHARTKRAGLGPASIMDFGLYKQLSQQNLNRQQEEKG